MREGVKHTPLCEPDELDPVHTGGRRADL
ncbi:MAG: hypothetical protein RLZZ355_1401, partial [Pseudomonadota bacterium]